MGVVGEPGISSKLRTVQVACPHDCPDGCSMRVTVDMASGRGIVDGDYCRLFNDRGEVFGHALIVGGLVPSLIDAQKQLQGSRMRGAVNINALTSQRESDMGRGPVFYSTLERVDAQGRGTRDEGRGMRDTLNHYCALLPLVPHPSSLVPADRVRQ